jgi:hypothetical protein
MSSRHDKIGELEKETGLDECSRRRGRGGEGESKEVR